MSGATFTSRAQLEGWIIGRIDDAAARAKSLVVAHAVILASDVLAEAHAEMVDMIRAYQHLPKEPRT